MQKMAPSNGAILFFAVLLSMTLCDPLAMPPESLAVATVMMPATVVVAIVVAFTDANTDALLSNANADLREGRNSERKSHSEGDTINNRFHYYFLSWLSYPTTCGGLYKFPPSLSARGI
jgi:hypothetical protein